MSKHTPEKLIVSSILTDAMANAARIESLWNAMLGIPDPSAFVKAARELAAMDMSGDEMRVAAADRLRAADPAGGGK